MIDYVSTQIVTSHNNTMETCAEWLEDLEYVTYRPNQNLLASRNAHLHQVMNYSSSPLY